MDATPASAQFQPGDVHRLVPEARFARFRLGSFGRRFPRTRLHPGRVVLLLCAFPSLGGPRLADDEGLDGI